MTARKQPGRKVVTDGLRLIVAPYFLRLSYVLAGIDLVMAGIYLLRPPPRNPSAGVVNLVRYIENFGPPAWVLSFGLVGVLLILAARARRRLSNAHYLCGVVTSFYAAAVLIGAAMSTPMYLSPTGLAFAGITITHLSLSVYYREAGL